MFLEQLINGITLGSNYAIVALGFTLVFGVLNIINMSHGEIFMFGAFMGSVPGSDCRYWCHGLFFGTFRIKAIRGKQGVSHLAPLISTIGVSIFLENLAHHLFGAGNHPFRTSFSEISIKVGSITIYVV